ncbi:hypothetical protein EVAR_65217_1 [Eumeta japonica]|uniref:Uncharacterized protein n=1 Tax=Eumeta variegata TaxID=151549 RepID=A0A4C2A463_EUMVA|nr:hypothetical protein EVAR_65217_1 [Eumeta japonica]
MGEIMKTLKLMKVGKAAGYDRVSSEILSGGEVIVARLLYQLFNKYWKSHRGVRQRCVASPWLFNLFIDSCRHDLKEYECGLRMDEMSLKCILYADDQVILVASVCGL